MSLNPRRRTHTENVIIKIKEKLEDEHEKVSFHFGLSVDFDEGMIRKYKCRTFSSTAGTKQEQTQR